MPGSATRALDRYTRADELGRVSVLIDHIDEGEVVGVCGPVLIRVVDGGPTELVQIDRVRRLVERELGNKAAVGLWIVLHHGTPSPSLGVARHSRDNVSALADRLCVVYSMLGIGFWAATVRKVAAMFNRLIGTPAPFEATIEDGARRMGLELVGADPEALLRGVEEMTERLREYRVRAAS